MASEVVQLTGDALYGIVPPQALLGVTAPMPREVKLGCNIPRCRPQALRLEAFVDKLKAAPPPEKVDWYTKAAASLGRMYLNDRWGDCVFAGKAHNLGVWSANDTDSGPEVLATDKEIEDQYFAYTGGRDAGAVIYEVLDYMKANGFLAGGKRYKIDGYVSADWRSKELTQIGLAIFGCGSIGFSLPSSWTGSAVWDVTNSRIVGGHDVSPCGYGNAVLDTNADGVVVSSWGRLYLFTWSAWTSARWISELYFMVPEFLWTGIDKRAPSNFDFAGLKTALAQIGGGDIPPLPEPTPPSPPVPPTPPVPMKFPDYHGSLKVPLLGELAIHLAPVFHEGPVSALPWRTILQDCLSLVAAVLAKDIPGIIEAVKKLVEDFTRNRAEIEAHASRMSIGPGPQYVAWLALIRDIRKLVDDFQANAPIQTLIDDAKAIARDLGFEIPW